MNRILLFLFFVFAPTAHADIDYHFVGWSNALIPGSGQAWLGNYGMGAFQLSYEVGTFYYGYHLSGGQLFSLDGFTSQKLTGKFRTRDGVNSTNESWGDILQEFSIKAHMVNTYEAYVEAARRSGKMPDHLDDSSVNDLFLAPFQPKYYKDPYVYAPIAFVFLVTLADYISQTSGTIAQSPKLTPSSNALYAFNYSVWQPIGSGAPEEMFYRGFLQNEMFDLVPNPVFAISMSTLAFAFSHEPGNGRYSAGAAGAYLGYLANRNGGRLGPGITVHFWSSILLGLETVLLAHKGQRDTPPASLDMQVNF